MKKYLWVLFLIPLIAWMPQFINNSHLYQGGNSVINISSGTIRNLNTYGNLDVVAGSVTIKVNGTTKDFSIDSSSATFYDSLYLKSNLQIPDNINIFMGNDNDYDIAYRSSADHLAFKDGGALRFLISPSSVVVTGMPFFVTADGGTKDFSIDSSSATFYDPVKINGNFTTTGNNVLTGGVLSPYSRTEAQLKALNGGGGGAMVFDNTNNTIVLSTGGVGGWVNCYNGGAPTGW